MVSPPADCGLKDTRNVDNNIIISGYTQRKILPPQLKKISTWYKVMCGYE